jgi:hypothetical protein
MLTAAPGTCTRSGRTITLAIVEARAACHCAGALSVVCSGTSGAG